MSADRPADNDPDFDDETPRSWRAAAPVLCGGFVVVVVLVVVRLSALPRPTEHGICDDAKVQYVVNDMYSARNGLNYDLYRDTHCEKDLKADTFPTSQRFADENRRDLEANGKLIIPEMQVEVTGDRAAVSFEEHREGEPDAKKKTSLTLVKAGDEWKVCSA